MATIDPSSVLLACEEAVEDLAGMIPFLGAEAELALKDVLPAIVLFIKTELEGGRDPRPVLLSLVVAGADATAQAAEDAKFPGKEAGEY